MTRTRISTQGNAPTHARTQMCVCVCVCVFRRGTKSPLLFGPEKRAQLHTNKLPGEDPCVWGLPSNPFGQPRATPTAWTGGVLSG